jgi:hypothetical protein
MARKPLNDSRRAAEEEDRLDWPNQGLSPRSRAVAIAATEAFLADEDERGELVPGDADHCARAVDQFDLAVGRASPDVRRGMAVLTFLLEWLPLVILWTPARMSRLPLERRIAYLDLLENSRSGLLSMLFVAFKVPICIPAFEEGDDLALTGYDRPTTASRRRLSVAPREGSLGA